MRNTNNLADRSWPSPLWLDKPDWSWLSSLRNQNPIRSRLRSISIQTDKRGRFWWRWGVFRSATRL